MIFCLNKTGAERMDKAKKEEMLKKMRTGNFIENNGAVLRAINILRQNYIALKSVRNALRDVTEQEFLDSVNFLFKAGYIELQHIGTETPARLSGTDYKLLEATLSEKGIRLSGGEIQDKLVDV